MPSHEQRAIHLLSRTRYGRVAASRRAMPFVAAARHIVADGDLLLRLHKGHGYHEACIGAVIAYGTDNIGNTGGGLGAGGSGRLSGPARDGGTDPGGTGPDAPGTATPPAPDPAGHWTVQVIGTGERIEPSPDQLTRFGPGPGTVDGAPFDPVYIRLTPQFVTTHSADDGLERAFTELAGRGPNLPGPRRPPEGEG